MDEVVDEEGDGWVGGGMDYALAKRAHFMIRIFMNR